MIYNSFLGNYSKGNIKFRQGVDLFKCALVSTNASPAFTFNPNSNVYADLAGQIVCTGYTAGGKSITFTNTPDKVSNKVNIQFNPISWTGMSTGSGIQRPTGCVIYYDGATKYLVEYLDFGSPQTVTSALNLTFPTPLIVQW